MKPQIFNSRVLEIGDVTSSVKYLKLSVPEKLKEGFDFKAGQYFSLSVMRDDGKKIRKPFSLINVPSENDKIEFLIKLIAGGLASEYVKTLNAGDEVELFGPAGRFVVPENFDKDLIFIAAGVGVAPFVGMIRDLLKRGFEKKIVLIKSARNEDEILYDDLFNELSGKNSNFKFHNILSRPHDARFENKGYIQNFLEKYIPKDFEGNFYVCGFHKMIRSVENELTHQLDFSEDNIFYERFD